MDSVDRNTPVQISQSWSDRWSDRPILSSDLLGSVSWYSEEENEASQISSDGSEAIVRIA